MCGLCGIAGKGIQTPDLKILNTLLWITSIRGEHSTGVFAFNAGKQKKERYRIHKELGPSPNFIMRDDQKKVQDSILGSIMTDLYMGHCRYATKGKINVENAHPFDTGRFVSAHNGTLKDKKYDHATKTDSQMMFEDMEKRGVEEVINDLDYFSAWAVSIFDKHKKSITLGTNGDRPLYAAFNKDRRVLYWASELSFLHMAAERHREKLEFIKFEKNILYTVEIDKISTDGKFWNMVEFEKEKPAAVDPEWDWENMTWMSNNVQGPVNKKLDAFCCCCGSILYGNALKEADCMVFNNESYYTCADCYDPRMKEEVGKVKCG